eukprot:318466-Pelagomonas_calceolata.AAC.6
MSKLSSQRASPPQQPLPPKADSRTSSSSSMYPSSSRHATPTTGIEAHMEMQRPQGSNNSSSNHTNSAGAAGGDVGAWGGGGPPDESESGQKGHQLRKSNSLLDLPGAANVLVTPVERERHNQAQQVNTSKQQSRQYERAQKILSKELPAGTLIESGSWASNLSKRKQAQRL